MTNRVAPDVFIGFCARDVLLMARAVTRAGSMLDMTPFRFAGRSLRLGLGLLSAPR